ncbi:hypothetical protein HDV01_000116 [Terramyces sp. JEL0728]|nr:hypothetical protein HDV01_000116 [Terramyces sp. JEL0728]
MEFFIGVDVGTGSARAAIFTGNGEMVGIGITLISIRNPKTDYFEQSSGNIWESVCNSIKGAIEMAKVDVGRIKGIGFDATCSLVNLDEHFEPVPSSDNPIFNVTMWMDHRSHFEADTLSQTGNALLKFTGGSISPEMSIAKVLWMYKHNPEYSKIKHFFELPEYLTFRATNCTTRALCSLHCKWGYSQDSGNGWSTGFLADIVKDADMEALFAKFGGTQHGKPHFHRPGDNVGKLSKKAANEIGCPQLEGIAVGGAVIDAYAGAIATLCSVDKPLQMDNKMAIICGTSSCFITMNKEPNFTKGVWGPYNGVLCEGYSCMEGGQTLTGKAIEVFLNHHPTFSNFKEYCLNQKLDLFAALNENVERLSRSLSFPAKLTRDVHVLPDCHGNRSPIANQNIRGMLTGISLPEDGICPKSLAVYYYSTLLSLCYSARHIIESLRLPITDLYLSGGLSTNPLWCQSLADVTGCRVYLPGVDADATVLLGAAMCGYAASTGSLINAMIEMSRAGRVVHPNVETSRFHNAKYDIFLEMYRFEELARSKMLQFDLSLRD